MLNIIFEFRRGILFVRMNGVLDKKTYLKYKEEVLFMIKENGIKNVVLNLRNISKIDLKGINLLFYTYELVRDNKGRLILSDINELIHKKLNKSHLFKYVDTIDHEIESFKVIV
ncbi:MAG: STAS domain-containing protein [Bacilli bacterium]|nr:STAS domain-containing protein [Bacilli bacterium]